jgi:hypothetical protein
LIEENENSDDWDKKFNTLKEIVNRSLFFANVIKKECQNKKSFIEDKIEIKNHIEQYHFFGSGKYFTLAIFARIFKKCEYLESIK